MSGNGGPRRGRRAEALSAGTLLDPDTTVGDRQIGDVHAEAALAGAVLTAAEAGTERAAAVLGDLTADDFTDSRVEIVVDAARTLLDRGTPPDPVMVLGELRRTGAVSRFTADRSAAVFLADLVAGCPAVANAGHYAAVVVEHTARRRAVQAAERIKQAAEGAGDLAGLADLAVREVAAVEAACRRCAA